MSFVNASYSIDKLLFDLHRGRTDELVEIMQGKLNGKATLIDILKEITAEKGGLNSAASEALSGVFLPAVEKLAEKEGIKINKLKRTLKHGLVELLKLRGSKLTLIETLKQLVESPTDELVEQLQTFIVDRESIHQQITEAKTSKTDLINALLSTGLGKKRPANHDEFMVSPQVKHLYFSVTYTLGRAKENYRKNEGGSDDISEKIQPMKLNGFVPIEDNKNHIIATIQASAGEDSDGNSLFGSRDKTYYTLTYPPLYDKIFGKEEIIFEVEHDYSPMPMDASLAVNYLLAVGRMTKANSLFPELDGGRTNTTLIKKGKNINPYLLKLLESESTERQLINELLTSIGHNAYISDKAITEVTGFAVEDNVKYFYSDIVDAIENGLNGKPLAELDEEENKLFFKSLAGSKKLKRAFAKKPFIRHDSPSGKINASNIIQIERTTGKAPFISLFEEAIQDADVKIFLNRAGISNPSAIVNKTKVNMEQRSLAHKPDYQLTSAPSNIISAELDDKFKTDSDKIIYNMALKGDIKFRDVDFYMARPDPQTAIQAYFNFAHMFGSDFQNKVNAVEEIVGQEDSEADNIVSAVVALRTELNTILAKFVVDVTNAIAEKLKDVVKRPSHYVNELSNDKFLSVFLESDFIEIKSETIEEVE